MAVTRDTTLTPEQARAIYASLPGPTPAQMQQYQQQLDAYNARMAAATPEFRARVEALAAQGGGPRGLNVGPPMMPMSPQQQQFTDWLGNGGFRTGYSWTGQQVNSGGFEGAMETVTPVLTAAMGGAVLGPMLGAAAGATSGGIASGAITGATTSALGSGLTGSPLTAKSLATGAIQGAIGAGATGKVSPMIQQATGLGPTAANAITQAGVGALGAGLSGKNVLAGAAGGAAGSLVSSNLNQYGASPLIAGMGGSLAANLTRNAIGGNNSSSSGGGSTLSPGVSPPTGGNVPTNPLTSISGPQQAQVGSGDGTGGSSGGFWGSLGAGLAGSLGLDPNNLLGSLGSNLGQAVPYAAVAGLGINQASKGRQQDQQYIDQIKALGQPFTQAGTTLLNNAMGGKLSQTDQNALNTATSQGNTLLSSASGLSSIAQQAFQNYQAGKLPQADEQALASQIAAQKQAVRQQLASAGITDSTILAGQDQQIDNQASILRQQLLDQRFATGNQAYDRWLTATQAGQQTIRQGQQFASQQLQNMMQNAFASGSLGMGAMENAIQTAMQTDERYATQVSDLLGTLVSAYAYQIAKKNAGQTQGAGTSGSGGSGSSVGKNLAGLLGGSGSSFVNSPEHQQFLQQDWSNLQNELNLQGNVLGNTIDQNLSQYGQDYFSNMTPPDLGGGM